MKKDAEIAREELTAPRRPKRKLLAKDLLSTGSTILNLALSGKARGGLYKGRFYWLIGDSDTGKTVEVMTIFAEATINPEFKGHRLIFDDPELGALFDLKKLFGQKLVDRIEPPAGTREEPVYSSTVEELYDNVDNAFDAGKPFIYVLDSMDAISSAEEIKTAKQRKQARKTGAKEAGSYGVAKAKKNSAGMRALMARLKKSDSILIIISQVRTNLAPMTREKKTTSGGMAFKFYATAQIWNSPKGKIKTTYNKREYEQGILVKVRVRKNRQTGRKSDLLMPILWSAGIDDLGCCVDWLVSVGHWTKAEKGGQISAPEFGGNFRRDKLIAKIETENTEGELRSLVEKVWHEIQEAIAVKRKSRYG